PILEMYLDVLPKLPKQFEIEFCGYSEPFLNPNCADMMFETGLRGFPMRLCTTLVGFTLKSLEIFSRVKGVHYILIHVPDRTQFIFPAKQWIELHERFLTAKMPADYDYTTMD